MFFPPAVMMMSFLRSVIFTKPSASISPTSPVRKNPSSRERGRRCLGILEVAPEDAVAAHEDLAVVLDADLAPLDARPTVPKR